MLDIKVKWPDKLPEPEIKYGDRTIHDLLNEIADECHEGLILANNIISADDFFEENFSKKQAVESINYLTGKLHVILDLLGD